MIIRPAVAADIPAIMTVLEAARGIMRASGNPFQWPDGYPTQAMIEKDLAEGVGRVFEAEGAVVGYFACIPGPDPTYAYIEDGAWLEDTLPYYVIHRIASLPDVHGIFQGIIDYTGRLTGNIRIDTHKDNRIMQHALEKHGFTYCGIIYLTNGAPRLAYQRIQ
ncbi:MAG: N-acetyltransferase [Bacteroidales bacterium]|nr:N-acetyltransferase [Bacteroidales bacterium]